jgi:aminopeptidase Y
MPKAYIPGPDFQAMSGGIDGTAQGTLLPVDLVLPPTPAPSSTSGCEASDFAGFVAGSIALIQRGTCTFNLKALNAMAAGAAGVIIFNEGQPGRTDAGVFLLGDGVTIPVLFASFAVGNELAQARWPAR